MTVRPTDPLRSFDWDEPVHVDGSLDLRGLAGVLRRYRVGVVLAPGPTGSLGVVGERDLVDAVARGLDLDTTTVSALVERDLVTADTDERIVDVARRLLAAGIRHVAVTRGDVVVAVVSTRDLLAVLVDAVDAVDEAGDAGDGGDRGQSGGM